MSPIRLLGAALACTALAASALAASPHASHGTADAASHNASTAAYQKAAQKMHEAMDFAYTGDADVDFARGMIAHHEGAIDMARIQLEHGKDPALEKLSRDIIVAQEKEIAFLRKWLAQHAPR